MNAYRAAALVGLAAWVVLVAVLAAGVLSSALGAVGGSLR